MSETSSEPYLKVLSSAVKKHTLFGYRMPHLPDFLADHTLLGERPSDRIEEFHQRWVQFVGWLWKWRGSAFALRYLSDPQNGEIRVYVLGRMLAESHEQAEQVAADLGRLLVAFGLPTQPLAEDELQDCLSPFDNPALVEICQHEENLSFPWMGDSHGYVVHSYTAPGGSFLAPFESLMRQSGPAMVSLFLEPTELMVEEREALVRASAIAETMKERELTGDFLPSELPTARFADPQLAVAARLYITTLKRLAEPFITVAQVASPDPAVAISVARTFSRAFTHEQASDTSGDPLPSSSDVIHAADPVAADVAMSGFQSLTFNPRGASLADQSPGMSRLRYLADAKGAAVAWRLPINVRGGVPGIAVRQSAPDFEPGPRPVQLSRSEIHLGTLRRGGKAAASVGDLTRHALITGFTGSGKTNTVLYLLDQLWREHGIPFMVIEAAKKEYRALLRSQGFEDLLIFTLGDESTSPLRLNPFELLPGVRVETHIGRLQTCFDAALPQFGILPSIVAEALDEIYKARGWKQTDRAAEQEPRLYPTMSEMYAEVIRSVERRGYSGETRDNIRAAAAGRIGGLLRGSRGRMMGAQRSIPADMVFSRPVVLELNDLNEDDKALLMMFLLVLLREYRELHQAKELQHVTVIEEAHNVVSNVQSVSNTEIAADTKAKAVDAFTNMLAEVRAYGEGIMISDQSPERLAPDAMRNTNLQIAHQLRDRRDREAIARAMIMDEEQQDYLGKLRVGEAALFRTGFEKATFIAVPEFKDSAGFDDSPSDADVRNHMSAFRQGHIASFVPFDGCRFCGSPCEYREAIDPITLNTKLHGRLLEALSLFDEQPEPEHWPSHWREIVEVCSDAAEHSGHGGILDASYCFFAHEIDFPFTEHMRLEFVRAASKTRKD